MFNFNKKIVLMGGGKLACMIYSTFHKYYNFVGYVDDIHEKAHIEVNYGIRKIGTSKDLPFIASKCRNVIIAINSEGDNSARDKYFNMFLKAGFSFSILIAPSALIAEKVSVGKGCIIQSGVIIDNLTSIGDNCLVASNSVIRHDVRIGNNVVIAPGVNVNGEVTIGNGVFLGTGSIVISRRNIGDRALVGAGTCVINDVPAGSKVVGVPARQI